MGFITDANKVFFMGYPVPLQAGSLTVLGDYAHDGRQVAFKQYLIDADASSFEALAHAWARDRTRVFHDGVAVHGADPSSFQVLSDRHGIDAQHAYWKTRPVPGAKPRQFCSLGDDLSKDDEHVFDCTNTIEGVDAASFHRLDATWSLDAHRVYREGQAMPGVSPQGFEVRGAYLVHTDAVWFGEQTTTAQVDSFIALPGDFGRDAQQVFFQGVAIAGADPRSFEVVRGPFGQDAATMYLGGEPWDHRVAIPTTAEDLALPLQVLRWRKSAQLGDANAMFEIAGYFGTEANRNRGRLTVDEDTYLWTLAAAAFGHAEAATWANDSAGLSKAAQKRARQRLIKMLQDGDGVPQNLEAAEKLRRAK